MPSKIPLCLVIAHFTKKDIASIYLDGRVQCPECNKFYGGKKSLATHFSAHHSRYGGGKACQGRNSLILIIILIFKILVLLPVSTLPYVGKVNN
jgi:hypothetical protein